MNRTPLVAVVDDEESIRRALERLLRANGMKVETFASGREFLDAVHTQPFDVVVLDLHMAGIGGIEVQAKLAQQRSRLPVIVVTGHDTSDMRATALAGGAAAYLLKPIDDRVLLGAIATAIATRKR